MNAEEFDRIAKKYCGRWEKKSLDVARSILVDNKKVSEVAQQFAIDPRNANTYKYRFIEKAKRDAAVKVGADEFMLQAAPAGRALDSFSADIKKLVQKGYSNEQVAEFLRINECAVQANDLAEFIDQLTHGGNP